MRVLHSGRKGYSLIEVIGVVVICGILLGMVTPAVAHAVRVRLAEAVLKGDLQNAANLYEEVYLAERRYPEDLPLQDHLSPGIAVDSQAVKGERVFVRLRHVATGQLCALDYSRSSAVARNRSDCYGGGQARDSAFAITPEPPGAPGADTFGIPPLTPPDTGGSDLGLRSPEVSSPADQSGAPGATLVQTFVVTNRSAVARTFRFEVGSSSPAVVPTPPALPDPLTLAPGVPTQVRVTYSVAAGAIANASSVIPLRAVDTGDERWSATGTFTFTTTLALAAPRVEVTGPAERTETAGAEFDISWEVTNRSNAARILELRLDRADPSHVDVLSVTALGRVPFDAGESRVVTARLRLTGESDGGTRSLVTLHAHDAERPTFRAVAPVTVETSTVLADPVVDAPAPRTMAPGTAFEVSWTVHNRSNAARSFRISAAVDDPGHLEVISASGDGSQVVPRGGAHAVTVTCRVRATTLAGRESRARLDVADEDVPAHRASGSASVETELVLAAPSVVAPAAQSAKPGAEFVVTWTVRNESNAARLVAIEAPAPAAELDVLSSAGDGNVSFSAYEARPVSVRYRVRDASLAGAAAAPALRAMDVSAPAYAARASFDFATAAGVRAPEWVRVPASPQFWDVGDQRQLGYTFRNSSNVSRTFCVAISSSDPAKLAPVAGSGTICGVQVPPHDTVRVAHALRALGAGTALRVDALVYDQDESAHRDDAWFYNAVRETRPTAVWDAPDPIRVRKWATFDGSGSWSPVGAPIVRYVWTWGLFMQQWDEEEKRFVFTGNWETARDEVGVPSVDRAYDVQGSFSVCLTVIDNAGRASEPNCQTITTLRPTLARLAWRYRGWWTDLDWCFDVWWDNQCDPEHANARWEIDLAHSVGDSPIRAAYAVVRVRLHNTDDPDQPMTVTYSANSGTTPVWGTYSFATDIPSAVGSAQAGRWRVLSTTGTSGYGWPAGASLSEHPLVLNVNLGKATGIFDGGPHWVPDDAWITLYVQDDEDRWTSVSGYRNHDKSQWAAAYDTVATGEDGPYASVTITAQGGGTYVAAGAGDSPGGRILDAWWEIRAEDLEGGEIGSWTARGPTVELQPSPCERLIAAYVVKDDQGSSARGADSVMGNGGSSCSGVPGGGIK